MRAANPRRMSADRSCMPVSSSARARSSSSMVTVVLMTSMYASDDAHGGALSGYTMPVCPSTITALTNAAWGAAAGSAAHTSSSATAGWIPCAITAYRAATDGVRE